MIVANIDASVQSQIQPGSNPVFSVSHEEHVSMVEAIMEHSQSYMIVSVGGFFCAIPRARDLVFRPASLARN
jgi:protoporphyrinogen oxidase